MASTTPRKNVNISTEAIERRIEKLLKERTIKMANVKELHVKLMKGNRKTGTHCWTVSLLPMIDCCNCSHCSHNCYDLRNDMIYPTVVADRAKNSAIHKVEPQRYWSEISNQIRDNSVKELRLNVGGDLTDEDFKYVKALGKVHPDTMILFFTKNYEGLNKFLDNDSFTSNVHPIMSAWEGMECDNRHGVPMSHVLYADGRTTAPEYGAIYCGGNCSECALNGDGCWNLKKGEHVIFNAH